MDQRLQKILSAGGVCSRRKAEEYLREGRVTVNGVPATLGDKADPETDTIAPKPDPDGFGRTTEPAVIQSVIDASAELLGGQKTVWQRKSL